MIPALPAPALHRPDQSYRSDWPTAFILGLALALLVVARGGSLHAAEPDLRPEELPHFPPLEPAAALSSFELRPGFRLELAAHEPEVFDPVALSFDERGRAYVIEMRDYSERRPERLGRVRWLEDRDADGYFETSDVFLDDLPWPTAITCWNGGVFVAVTPDILYARDNDGDGRADMREVIFTGFASGFAPYETNRLNVQAMMNSLQWSPDCRIHGSASMSGGKVMVLDSEFTRAWRASGTPPARHPLPSDNRRGAGGEGGSEGSTAPSRPVVAPPANVRPPAPEIDLRGRDFSFDPRTLELRTETGGGQHGMTFDDEGRKFLCSNSDHLQVVRYDDRRAERSAWFPLPAARVSIAADGPAAEVFRISPDEPWRVIRTRWRVTGLVPGLIEGGGRASGYFTGATGLTIYRGDAYGPEFVGDAFVADCGSNLIHRKKLRSRGCELIGERPADERKREFLASRDTWFRPVQFANAPDGCLWMIDMYREIIEHPWSLPANLKRWLDLNAGNDRGRLYRIAPDGAPLRRQVDLTRLGTEQLVRTLSHSNGWHRDTASRLLCERRNPAAVDLLRDTVRATTGTTSLARLHALSVLNALDACRDTDLAVALEDPAPAVRRHAVRLSEVHFLNAALPPTLAEALAARVKDTAPVRLELAFALGGLKHPRKVDVLAQLLRSANPEAGEALVADAALAAAGADALGLIDELTAHDTPGPAPIADLSALAGIVGRRNDAAEVSRLIGLIGGRTPEPWVLAVAAGLGDGLRSVGASLQTAARSAAWSPVIEAARRAATNSTPGSASNPMQLDAIRLLGHLPPQRATATLLAVLDAVPEPGPPTTIPGPGQADSTSSRSSAPVEAQRMAFEALLRGDEARATEALFSRWTRLAPGVREPALDQALRRPAGSDRVLDAIAAHRLAPQDLTASQLVSLRTDAAPATRARAVELLGAPAVNRNDAIAAALSVLNLRGEADRGRAVHLSQCAPCHRLAGVGHALGPDLESVKSQPGEQLLVAILDPNREVQPAYLATTVETADHESFTGLLAAESSAGITLRQAGGLETQVARANVGSVKAEGRSLMPEGFETTLTLQQMADLLALLAGQP